jgi:spermidine synthase
VSDGGDGSPAPPRGGADHRVPLLYLNVLVIATAGLIYELLAGTVASYVLGDSVRQFSLIIGLYLSAMGVGAWLSRYVDHAARTFVDIELGVALVGGISAPLLLIAFARIDFFPVLLYGVVFVVGTLVGLELPLLMRILKDRMEFKDLVARVLTFDYLGALAASLLFPIVLVPTLGLVRTSLLFGMCNAAVGLWGTWLLGDMLTRRQIRALRVRSIVVLLLLTAGLFNADRLTSYGEDAQYADTIIHAETTPYQRIVVTRGRAGFQLFLNGNLQFSSTDEYRYHEALVHPAVAAAVEAQGRPPARALVLGGGDGLAVRELLKHASIGEITLVDLDPAMPRLGRELPLLARLNEGAFTSPRVREVADDAYVWLGAQPADARWDVIIVDFPDPNSFALGKLYTRRFYQLLRDHLAPGGAAAVQATSPLFARASYWCIVRTIEAAGLHARPYQLAVPSFGVWGFVLARGEAFAPPAHAPQVPLRYLDDQAQAAMFLLSRDTGPMDAPVNRLDNQVLVRLYEQEWHRFEQ